MISLKEKVCGALSGVCAEVVFGYPRDFTGNEMISWRESANRRHAQVDGREYLAELNYTLEIFAAGPAAAYDLLSRADERMLAAGLRREACAEQFEQDTALSHISARYRALADAQGRIYQ